MATAADVDNYLKGLMLKDLRIQCRLRGVSPAGSKETLTERLREYMTSTQDFTIMNEHGEITGYLGEQQLKTVQQTIIGLTETKPDNYAHQSSYQHAGQIEEDKFLRDRNSYRVTAPPGGSSYAGVMTNNYQRPEGQNVGNFISDRPSSKVLAPPGGGSNFSLSGGVVDPMMNIQKENLQHPKENIASPTDVKPNPPCDMQTKSEEDAQQYQQTGAAIGQSNNNYQRPGGQNIGNFITDRPSSRVLAAPGGGSSITFG
eukprot:TRINITY_DN1828_c0_g1_i1.p1 TRINITY_DN1828_c0_g1~~TRINITY_DN1828_c0_g1_i1.p1  ORF type:complete len:258 (-),score=29.33 TRINITY_DN1828_c0_g1_i1:266-1039(-)